MIKGQAAADCVFVVNVSVEDGSTQFCGEYTGGGVSLYDKNVKCGGKTATEINISEKEACPQAMRMYEIKAFGPCEKGHFSAPEEIGMYTLVGQPWENMTQLICTECVPGTFSNTKSGKRNCDVCDAGVWSDAGAEMCTPCAAGMWSDAGAASCTPCAAGMWSDAGAVSCKKCDTGKWSDAGDSGCTDCTAGTWTLLGNEIDSCKSCHAGTWSAAGADSCEICAPGKWSNDRAAECTACTGGKTSEAGSTGVQSCYYGKKLDFKRN